MPKILIVANADSPLLVDRVQMSINSSNEVVWYSESRSVPNLSCRHYHYRLVAELGPVNKICALFFFFWVYWREKPDILHVHWALFFPLMFRCSWKNLIVSVMGSDVNLPGFFGVRRLFNRITFSKAAAITSKSSSMDLAINKTGDYVKKIHRFTWGVGKEFFVSDAVCKSARDSFLLPNDALVIFSPRSVQPMYRIPSIIKAFIEFAKTDDKSYLLVAGMNSSKEVVAEIDVLLAGTRCEARVIRLDRLNKQQMIGCYAAADVVISYAQNDGMPQSLYEAMAAGCFPLFTNLPCYEEILCHEKNSLLLDTKKPSSLLKMLRQFKEEFHMKDLRTDIIRKNRHYIREIASKSSEQLRLSSLYLMLKKRF